MAMFGAGSGGSPGGFSSRKIITISGSASNVDGVRKPFGSIISAIRGTSSSSQKSDHQSDPMTAERRQKFEAFLTHRRRLTRVSIIQALYFYDYSLREIMAKKAEASLADRLGVSADSSKDPGFVAEPIDEVNEAYRTVIFFYKKVFFRGRYGDSRKTKKLEEKFLRSAISNFFSAKEEVDRYIKRYLKKGWTLYRLDPGARAILRAAVQEALHNPDIPYKIMISEYSDIASSCCDAKTTSFVNAILDSAIKSIRMIPQSEQVA